MTVTDTSYLTDARINPIEADPYESLYPTGLQRDLKEQWEYEASLSGIFMRLRDTRGKLSHLLAPERLLAEQIQPQGKYSRALETASQLADEYSPLAYHSHHHAREVTLLTQKLLAIHQSGDTPLPAEYVYLTLIAACIHDYKHNGMGNRAGAAYVPVLLEQYAVESAWPHLEKAGLGPDDKTIVQAIVDATDVFAPPHHDSPRAHLRECFNATAKLPAAHPRFATSRILWEQDPHVRTCAAILSDADLGLTCGMPQPFVNFLIERIEIESKGTFKVTQDVQKDFYLNVCAGFPLTHAGQRLLGSIYQERVKQFEAPRQSPA